MEHREQGSAPRGRKGSDSQLISVLDVLHIVRQRWLIGTTAGIMLGGLVAFGLLRQTPSYEAEASMMVELNPAKVVNVQEVVESGVKNSSLLEAALNAHQERLRSRSMAQQVVEALSEEQLAALEVCIAGPLSERGAEAAPLDPAGYLKSKAVKVSGMADSQILHVNVTLPDPVLAADIADLYVKEYIRFQMGMRNSATSQAVVFLAEQIEEQRQRLEQGEQALQEYRRKHNLVSIEQNQSIMTQRMRELSSSITGARVRLHAVQSRLDQIENAGDNLQSLMNIPFVGDRQDVGAMHSKLRALQTDRSILQESYLPLHPKMVENQAAIDSVNESLWHAIRQACGVIEIEEQMVLGELENLERELAQAEDKAFELDQLAIGYRVLARKIEAERHTFDMLTSRFNETTLSQQMQTSTIRILETAETPKGPVWPDVRKVGALSVLLCGMMMVGLPLSMEFVDNRLRSFGDIEGFIGKPVLGGIRYRKRRNEQELARAVLSHDEDLDEPFRGIYSTLRLKFGTAHKPLSLVVTSSLSGEGKSFAASNLAEAYATHHVRTLLVDCDLRRPSLHRCFGLDNEHGIIRWLRSEEPLSENIHADVNLGIRQVSGSPNLFLLSSGGSTKEATEVLEDARLDLLIARLKQEFDLIVYDTPPVGLFPDATVVADHADHCVFVARQNCVSRQKARYAVSLMDQSGAPVTGVIFNGIRSYAAAKGYGSGGIGSGYSYAFGYEKNASKYTNYYAEAR